MTAAVLTPFTAGEAVELGNRVWRKRLLPIGDVEYKGRTLQFTRKYLGQIVDAFNSRAYDQVPFQLADSQNAHTNDPERTRGEITGMELGDDGLYVTAELTPEGEKVLAANPKLGVSARIVEDYARSDGRFFKSAVQHVLGTLDPRIPGLGAWEAIEAASPEPETVLDLSAESFVDLVGPKGYSHGWVYHGTGDLKPSEKADLMSKNISRRAPSGAEAQAAHREAAQAHRRAAFLANTSSGYEHHRQMQKQHQAAAKAAGRSMQAAGGATHLSGDSRQTDFASDSAGADPEGGAPVADLTDQQKARLDKLLALPDDVLDALAAGGTVVTPEELAALTGPGEDPDGEEGEGDDDALAEEIAALSDEDLAALQAEFEAEQNTEAPGFRPNYMPEGEPVAAGLSYEAQFAIDMANSRAEEAQREIRVMQARLAEEDYQGEKRRLADLGVPPYITELAKPLLEGAGHAVELANGKTVDAGAVMRSVLTEFARQVKLLDLGAELGTPMDEPEDAGREEQARSRDDVVARFKQMTGLR